MSWETHTSILQQLRTFSARSAWNALADEFREPLVRFGERAGLPRDRAEDAAQETLTAFAQGFRAGRYERSKGRLRSWIFGIARRQVSSARRSAALDPVAARGTDESPSLLLAGAAPVQGDLEGIWEEEWQRSVLDRCLRRIQSEVGPETYQAFHLATFEGLSADEVAARLNVPRSRVYNAKHRVAARLRELALEIEDA